MRTHPEPCPACRRPIADNAHLCGTCLGVLGDTLASVPALIAELDTARFKQDRLRPVGAAGPRRSAGTLGYRPAALDAAERLRITLLWWTRQLAATLGLRGAPDHAVGCAAWLTAVLDDVRHDPRAVDMLGQIRAAVRIAWRVVDHPEPRHYAGPCDECGHDLYGYPRGALVVCRHCRASYPTAPRRAYMLDALREHLATAAEIANGIGELYGHRIDRKRINQWRSRGRLAEHGFTLGARHDPLFRIGDVLDLAAPTVTRSAKASEP